MPTISIPDGCSYHAGRTLAMRHAEGLTRRTHLPSTSPLITITRAGIACNASRHQIVNQEFYLDVLGHDARTRILDMSHL